MSSRKRSRAARAKKPSAARISHDGNSMPGLTEGGDSLPPKDTKGTKRRSARESGSGSTAPSRPPAPRLVYYDPAKVLPPQDRRAALGPEEAKRYRNRWLFTPATVLTAVDAETGVVLIRTKDMEVHRVRGSDLETVNPQALEGVPDAMNVSNLTEASLLHTIRERYNRDEVYTRVGPVLMSINPYKWIVGLYAEEAMVSYHGKAAMVEAGELAPHLFGVADHAYSQLVKGHMDADSETKEDIKVRKANSSNQSIIISGESGSGKTEATKIIMQYLARITSAESAEGTSSSQTPEQAAKPAPTDKAAGDGGMHSMVNVGELERRVLSCNPLLESFGNAVTLKNDNSSRFGKFIKIQFDKRGRILGAQIQNYLLEKTRIVAQVKRERSYHIFYQLLSGASSALKMKLHLEEGVPGFQCLKGSNIKDNDDPDFTNTKECLTKIGIEAEGSEGQHGQDGIFQLIAAIMHLLNVGFETVHVNGGEACAIDESTRPSLLLAAELLGVDSDRLEQAVVSKTMAVHSTSTRMLQTVEQAHDKAAALGKALYSQLFLWLVAKLNTTISAPQSDVWGFIGVLDIYGFEKFNNNSLEQLLINYANEHLQRHFNQHMFEVEQVDYEKEQIDWSYITFNDNKACLELIDGKGGLLPLLDDIQRFEGQEANLKFLASFKQKHAPPGGSSSSLRGRMVKSGSTFDSMAVSPRSRVQGGHPHFVLPRFDENISFGIKHYAGDVFYNVTKFNQKNRENLTADLKELMSSSTNDLVIDVFKAGEQPPPNQDRDDSEEVTTPARGRGGVGGRSIRSKSVGIQFKESLAELMGTISVTQPRYIRCVKPNPDKQSGRFDGDEVLLQLQYSGTMETIRIRQQGYALRELKDDFFDRYHVLQPQAEDVEALVDYLSNMLGASQRDWQIGTSKVFLRTSMSEKLNLMVELRRKCAARVIQRWMVLTNRRSVVRSVIQPFLERSVVILRLLRAAEHFRGVYLERRTAKKIAHWYRGSRDRRRYSKIKAANVVVKGVLMQSYCMTQLQYRKEFLNTTVEDLQEALKECDVKIVQHREAKEFVACRSLVSRKHFMDTLLKEKKEAAERRKSMGINFRSRGDDGNTTREDVEIRMVDTQWRLADAEQEQDFATCTRLQRNIKELEALRQQHPTLPELQERAVKAKADVEQFAAAADYGRAGSLQAELVKMEDRIAVMQEEAKAEVSEGGVADMSQKELDDLAAKTTEELEVAKTAKDFPTCMELQERLSEIKAAVDAMPTLEQLEEQVLSAEVEMAAAKGRKDYRRAAELSLKLPAMHDKHTAVASSTRKAMTRKQLAEEIRRLEGEMRLAKAEKRFNRCSLLQRSLEELHFITEALPTPHEIQAEISTLRVKMDEAVTEQHYAEAERYRVRLSELAEEKALAIEKDQHASAYDATGKRRISSSDRAAIEALAIGAPGSGAMRSVADVPPPRPPPTDDNPEDISFTSPQPVRVKQSPSVLSPVSAVRSVASPVRMATVRPSASVPGSVAGSIAGSVSVTAGQKDDRSVSRLRPKAAVTMSEETTVADVCRALSNARTDAGLLTGSAGSMTGIVTAVDIARRVVAMGVDPNSTAASEVMTPNPTSVLTEDSAMDALGIMLERHFRHLPVRSPRGDVTGVLDIAKCLYDAVSRLQRVAERRYSGGGGEELKISMMAELGKRKGRMSKSAMQALLAKMFEGDGGDGGDGGESGVNTSLADLLTEKGEALMVAASDSAMTAAQAIAKGRKAVLVVDEDGLAGILTEKDLLNRVLAKGLTPEDTLVGDVMTPNPDMVPSTMTVLEALQEMHENKYLHLPVVDESSGTIVGVVNVMEIIQATAGDRGSRGWQALFGSALDAGDDFSDTTSQASVGKQGSVRAGRASTRAAPSVAASVKSVPTKKVDSRPVSVLKPKPPLCLSSELTVFEVAKRMSDVRTDAAILLNGRGHLEGIVTDNDIARRVVAKQVEVSTTLISDVMTPHPTMVRMDDSAMECLGIMIEKHFRHLPVVDGEGNVAGLLNIAKCLHDAIHRLEKKARRAEEKESEDGDLAASMIQAATKAKGKGGKDLRKALAVLLAGDGDGEDEEPTLGGILASQTSSFVDGQDSVTAAAVAIAKGKKAVLVLEDSQLAGIITPKDLLMRVVAKGLDPDTTPVSDVMTPNPDTVPPDMTVMEALREMHENKYLHLPVVDEDRGMVEGVVNVMEIVQATAGDKGSSRWEAFIGSAMDAGEEFSDTASMYSLDKSVMSVRQRGRGAPRGAVAASVAGSVQKKVEKHRPVSSLKPKAPLCLSVELSVAEVATKMAEVRTDAVILLGSQGDMRGIMTDHDVARKVVGQSLDPNETPVASVMMSDPTWVNSQDSAMDALATMMEQHFRHLPVVNGEGSVSGLLSIAKCLYDAIHRLDKKAMRDEENRSSSGNQELAASLLKMHAKKGDKKKAMAAMAELLLSDGQEETTLQDILSEQTGAFVDEGDSVSTAGKAIARTKKAVLVLSEGQLTGIVTPKDLLMRVVAKGLDSDTTAVSDVMTPNPDAVPPETTVLEALREMHENKYLHLPVVDESSGAVVGVVGVMEIIQATAGDRGSDSWEALFGTAIDAGDDVSDSASMFSVAKSIRSVRQRGGGAGGVPRASAAASVSGMSVKKGPKRSEKPVSSLRPKRPIMVSCEGSVLEVAKEMARKRTDAALLTRHGGVVGIVTDHDLTRRVIALDLPTEDTAVREIMTSDPATVGLDESAMDALGLMLEKRTRHLPVTDTNGKVTGLLDIAKCLYDAVNRLEKAAKKKEAEEGDAGRGEDSSAMLGVMLEAAKAMKGNTSSKDKRALKELMLLAMSGTNGEQDSETKTLADVLASKEEAQFVRPRHTVREAAGVIASQRKAVLVVEEGELVGIFTPKDMMTRVIAKSLSPGTTAVSSVMTPNPDGGSPSMTVVEALQQMVENRYLHLPVVDEETGEVMGVVDVMEIIQATVGQEGSSSWEAFFGSAMDAADDVSDTVSQGSIVSRRSMYSVRQGDSAVKSGMKSPHTLGGGSRSSVGRRVSVMPMAKPPTMAMGGGGGDDGMSEASRDVGGLQLDEGWDEKFVYKVSDDDGNLYKFKASAEKVDNVLLMVSDKLKMPKDAILLKYQDDDGDEIVLSGDESLHEAVDMARASSAPSLKLVASMKLSTLQEDADDDGSTGADMVLGGAISREHLTWIGIGVGAIAGIALIAAVFGRKRS